jgi:amidase
MARDPADLELALSVLAGPAGLEATGCRLALPAPRHEALADFRVLLIESHPLARVAEEIRGALHATAARLEAGGGRVARSSEAVPDLAGAHQLYMGLLITALSRGAAPDGLPPAGVMSAHDWMNALDAQLSLRRQWARLFEDFDVVLAPTLGVVAFEHVTGEWAERTLTIDGVETPFADQLAWPGMATVANLPVTAAPIGTTRPGLPIGMQIIGPYLEDRTPLAFARLLAGL